MDDDAPVTTDSRSGARRRTLLRGRICWGPKGALSVDCSIRNISEAGAQLRVAAVQALPQTFTLIHVLDGVAYEATLAWRRGDLAGARFTARHDLKRPGDPAVLHLRQTWLALAPR
ncbi:MAG: hypothetical protein ABW042_06940 [Phenylobacterium sp.]